MRRTFAHFSLEESLGTEAVGSTYRGRDSRTGAPFAVFIFERRLTPDAEAIARLRHEARIAAQLDHPNVVRVLEEGQVGDECYVVAALVDGETLRDRLRREPRLSDTETHRIALSVAHALNAAHAQRVIHRNLTPDNILLTGDGQALVRNFGFTQALDTSTLTRHIAFIAAPEYAAPELDEKRGDIRCDLYALGVIMFEMLVGRVPSHAAATRELVTSDRADLRHASRSLAPIVGCLLESDPGKRYTDPDHLVKALQSVRLESAPVAPVVMAQGVQPLAARSDKPTEVTAGRSQRARVVRRAVLVLGGGLVSIAGLTAGGFLAVNAMGGGGHHEPETSQAFVGSSSAGSPTRTLGSSIVSRTSTPTTVPASATPDLTLIHALETVQSVRSARGAGAIAPVRAVVVAAHSTVPPELPPPPATSAPQQTPMPLPSPTARPTRTATQPPAPPPPSSTPAPTEVAIASDASWQVYDEPASTVSLGSAQVVCLRRDPAPTPPDCPAYATSWDKNGTGGWSAALSPAQWIWAPGVAKDSLHADYAHFYFQRCFMVPGIPTSGVLQAAVDRGADVYVNGQWVQWVAGANAATSIHILPYVVTGTNCVAFLAYNDNACSLDCPYQENPAGLIVAGSVTFAPS